MGLWQHIRPRLWRWAVGTLMLLCTNATSMALPQLFRRAINQIHDHTPPWALQRLALQMVAVALGGAVFRTASRILILYAARDAELSLRALFYRRLTGLDSAFFAQHPTGDLMSRATNDLTQVRLMLGPGLLNAINTLVAYLAAVPLMLAISPRLTAVAFVVYPPTLLLMRRLGRLMHQRNRAQQQALGALSNVVQENLSAAAMVRTYAIEHEQVRRFAGRNDAYLHRTLGLAKLGSAMSRVSGSLSSAGVLAVALFGAAQVTNDALTLGDVVALVEYMGLLSGPTWAMGWVLSMWQRGVASLGRLQEVIQAQSTIVDGERALSPGAHTIAADHLRIDYGDGRGLHDVCFTLTPGQTLGIVGAIGSGKTTLARALLRLVALDGGSLRIDGALAEGFRVASVRAMFGYVPQGATLLSKSLYDNVAFGRPSATPAEVDEVLGIAQLRGDAARLPDGTATLVGERGVTLSGGQKQRCALARALLVRAPILLLDDALSAVDTGTEARILAALQQRDARETTIIIAHRVSAVAHADEILVLDAGRICERGNHDALMAIDGAYARMVREQKMAVGPLAQQGAPNGH